jgi:hypothetical protein
MYIDLKQSVECLLNVESDKKRLDKFSRERYDEKFHMTTTFLIQPTNQGYHYYDTFKVIDENTIKIFFRYGIGDYEYDDSFDVDMRLYYREEKLNLLDI